MGFRCFLENLSFSFSFVLGFGISLYFILGFSFLFFTFMVFGCWVILLKVFLLRRGIEVTRKDVVKEEDANKGVES